MRATSQEQTGTRVLVADDDDDFRVAVAEALRSEGYAVVEARDGAEMLALIYDALADPAMRPEIVVADVQMPKLSGLGALEEMRRAGVRLPFWMMTGFSPSSVEIVAKRLGARGVLRKPFDFETLRSALLSVREEPPSAQFWRTRRG
jgi:DNA-binding response OmpR family regulator